MHHPLAQELVLVGLSHETAGVAVRERCAIAEPALRETLSRVARTASTQELFVLSTCNRTELVAVGDDGRRLESALRDAFPAEAQAALYVHHGHEAVFHVLSVSGGLRSMVLGEYEIQAQLKSAMRAAQETATLGPVLTALLQQALRAGKRIRNETALGSGTHSVAGAAVELVSKVHDSLAHCRALVIGAGETGLLVAKHLRHRGIGALTFTNRTAERADAAARSFSAGTARFESLAPAIAEHDVVIACVEAPQPLFGPRELDVVKWRMSDVPKIFVDLSVPRAIEGSLSGHRGAYLFDLDALQAIVARNMDARRAETERADRIIIDEAHKFLALRTYAALSPAVLELTARFEDVRRECPATRKAPENGSLDLDAATQDLSSKLLAVALSQFKAGARLTQSEAAIERSYRRYREQHP